MAEKIISLMKMVECRDHAEYLLDGGLYANRLKSFRDRERGKDELEGTAWLQPDKITIRLDGVPSLQDDLAGPVEVRLNRVAELHIFCMFGFWTEGGAVPSPDTSRGFLERQLGSINECIEEFGPYTVVVRNVTEFFRRVDASYKADPRFTGLGIRGQVRYIDAATHHTDLDDELRIALFKRSQFAHQREYRLVFNTCTSGTNPVTLQIDDIRDIAFCMKTVDVLDSVKITEG